MKYKYYFENEKTCTIYINDVFKNNKIVNCIELIKKFNTDNNIIMKMYRLDGINIPKEKFLSYQKNIEIFFKTNGNLKIFRNSPKNIKETDFLQGAISFFPTSNFYETLPIIFNYYLETSIYKLKIDQKLAFEIFNKYQMEGLYFYIEKNIADIVFAYVDSGDFIICFNKDIYSKEDMEKNINEYIF